MIGVSLIASITRTLLFYATQNVFQVNSPKWSYHMTHLRSHVRSQLRSNDLRVHLGLIQDGLRTQMYKLYHESNLFGRSSIIFWGF